MKESEGKKQLTRRERRRQNIKIHLKEIGRKFVDWIHCDQGKDELQAFVITAINFWVAQIKKNFHDGLETSQLQWNDSGVQSKLSESDVREAEGSVVVVVRQDVPSHYSNAAGLLT